MDTHTKLVMPVGIAMANTKPVMVNASPLNATWPTPSAHSGITICKIKRTRIRGKGFNTACFIDEKFEFKLPENVINAKIQGIKKEKSSTYTDNNTPITTEVGTINGMNFSNILLILYNMLRSLQ